MADSSFGTSGLPARSCRDRVCTGWYLTRLEWHLEGLLPGRERKAALRDLRRDLAADPRDTTAALFDLGTPRILARQYAIEGPRRPLWSIGAVSAGLALFVYWSSFLMFTFGMLAAVDYNAPAQAHAVFLFVDVEAFSSPDAVGIGWTSSWGWLMVPGGIVAISFLLGSRIWRLWKIPAPGH